MTITGDWDRRISGRGDLTPGGVALRPRLEVTARALLILLLAAILWPSTAAARSALPLGSPRLAETRTTDRLAPGVAYTRIVRGAASALDHWTVDVAVTDRREQARELARRLRAAGRDPRIDRLSRPPDDRTRGALGYRVRVGSFSTRAEADANAAALRSAGFSVRGSVFTAEDGDATSGPWVVHVLSVAPQAYARVTPALANDVVIDREPLSSIARRTDALAAVNGGYFVIGTADGTPGDLAGTSILDGELVSESVDGRTSLLLEPRRPSVDALRDAQWVRATDGAWRELDGVNRRPGAIRGCGGTGGDLPTERPLHDVTCTDDSELIRYSTIFGAPVEAEHSVVLDGQGQVLGPGTLVPPGGAVLAGTGDAAEWLDRHAPTGSRIAVTTTIRREHGPLARQDGLSVINGGPRLLRDGRGDITAEAEGFDHPHDPGFYYAFALRRNPRTLAGVDRDGRLLLVAADGRAPGYSAGLDFEEAAKVMAALGARDAVNLDGGGSTTMTVRGTVVTRPSDATGERPIADAIVIR